MAALSQAVVGLSGIWTWFNDPRSVYDPSTHRLFYAAILNDGTVAVQSWDFTKRLSLFGRPHGTTVLQIDDHANPALCLLDTGKILAAYSQHNGDSFSCRSTNVGDIRTWDTEVAVASGANDDAYAHLVQMGDTAKTVFWFYRRGAANPRPVRYRTSTDGGATWGGDTDLFDDGTNRPYFKCVKTSGSRIDFVVSTGQPDECANSLYHGYITVASDGSLTFFKTDGTQVTSPPFNPNEFTLVYDGTTNDGWQWDIETIGGTITIAYAVFTSANTVHTYYQARWNGSAWQSDAVADGGAVPDYLYAGEPDYSGGFGLDPNDINTVYVSRMFTATDFRLEKWTHTGTFPTGTWTQDSTIASTATINARPYCPRGLSPTTVLWWEGSYTSYTNYATRLRMNPTPSWRAAKPTSPVWTSSYAPSGVQAYFLVYEGSGTTLADLTGHGYGGSFTGSPTWNAGAAGNFGPFLSGLGTTAYVNIDTLAAAINVTGYPVWMVVLFKTTSAGTTQQWSVGIGNSASNNPLFGVIHNNAAATAVATFWRDTANVGSAAGASVSGSNSGEYHVLAGRKLAANNMQAMLDGAKAGNPDTSSTGAVTFNRGAIGCLRRAATSNGFTGEVHAVIVGWGAEPDPLWLALDLLQGQFAGTFNPDARRVSSIIGDAVSAGLGIIGDGSTW